MVILTHRHPASPATPFIVSQIAAIKMPCFVRRVLGQLESERITCKHGPHHAGSLEQPYSLADLGPFVPTANNVLRAAVGRCLSNTLEEADGSELGKCVARAAHDS